MSDRARSAFPGYSLRRFSPPLTATLHLVAGCGTAASYAEVDANPNPLREEVYPLSLDEGFVSLGDAPGLGVEPDLAALQRLVVLAV